MKATDLATGLPGHPTHPPLTDATLGTYTFAVAAATADVLGISENAATHGWWLALLAGLIVTVPTALTGLFDWLTIEWGSELWKTATSHMLSMLAATAFFGLAAIFGKDSFDEGNVHAGDFVLTLIGFGLLTLGGWLGGSVVYVHGMRVLAEPDKPARDAVKPDSGLAGDVPRGGRDG